MKNLIEHLEIIITAIETWEAPTNAVAVVRNNLIEHLDEAGTLLRVLRDDGFTAGGETPKLEEDDDDMIMTPEDARQLLPSLFPDAAPDDIESYIDGPDDPAAYFAKIANVDELRDDFEGFISTPGKRWPTLPKEKPDATS